MVKVDEILFLLFDIVRRMFDRGKGFELIQRPFCSVDDCEFSSGLTCSCSFILNVCSILMDKPNEEVLTNGYQLELLFLNSIELVLAKEGDCEVSGYLFLEMSLRDNIYQSSLTSLLGKYCKEIVQEQIYEQWVHASFLHYNFWFSAINEGWLNHFRRQVCRPAVIRVYKLEGGVPWFHVYSLMVIFFIVKRYDLFEISMIFTEQISQIIANMGKASYKVRIDEYLFIIIIFDRGKLLDDTSSSAYELENRVSHTMLLVWKGKLKSENFLCYPCCCVFDLRAQCIKLLSFNTSDSDHVEFHVFSLVVSLTNLMRSPVKLLRMGLNLVKMPRRGGIPGYSYGRRVLTVIGNAHMAILRLQLTRDSRYFSKYCLGLDNSNFAGDFESFPSHEWQQLYWVTGRRSCNKYLIVAAEYFVGTTQHLFKQLRTSTPDGSTRWR
ncbi:hypothetical protein C5167_024794 [Papaver somniferum]|uniref:Uncharacterized protein n=1 Tax=Papaver somniferum TaxID=3469 RepID=A0A4Y7JSX5_PAPSO|nr:hypothetical protein C5167_024794 [Papaver somniferum]